MAMRIRFVTVLAFLSSACVAPSPKPQIQPSPIGCVAVHVHDGSPTGPLLDGASVTVGTTTTFTAHGGYAYFYPLGVGPMPIRVAAADHVTTDVVYTVPVAAAGACDVDVVIQPTFVPLPALRLRGEYFEQVTGARFRGIESSDFNLLDVWLHDATVAAAVADQRRDIGFNMWRVWTRYELADVGIGTLTLAQHPDLYQQIPRFMRFAATKGAYVNFLAYPGGPPTQDWDDQHWAKLCAAMQGETNGLASLVNENNAHTVAPAAVVNTDAFQPCPGVLSSHGSNGSRSAPVLPVWDWAEAHWNNEPQWSRQIGHNGWEFAEQFHVAMHSDENRRAPDIDSNADHFYDAGQNAGLFIAAATFHSTEGKNSTLFSAQTEALARAFVAGMKSIPLDCQVGAYRHREDLERLRFTDDERANKGARIHQLGTDDRCISVVRPIQ